MPPPEGRIAVVGANRFKEDIMENDTDHGQKNSPGMILYVAGRAIVAVAVVGALLWAMTLGIDRINWPQYHRPQSRTETSLVEAIEETTPSPDITSDMTSEIETDSEPSEVQEVEKPFVESVEHAEATEAVEAAEPAVVEEIEPVEESHDVLAQAPVEKMTVASSAPSDSKDPIAPSPEVHPRSEIPVGTDHAPPTETEAARPVGVALV